MNPAHLLLSTSLLRGVLAGQTYEAAAKAHGLTRTAVERRVKSLVQCLVRERAIPGLGQSQLHFVRKLRAHRAAIEDAVQRYEPEGAFEQRETAGSSAPVLTPHDVQVALRRARGHTPTPERDGAMLLILLATGLRPLEVARLEVRDYLNADGSVRQRSTVRAEVAVNRRERPLFFASSGTNSVIDEYLRTRGSAPVLGAAVDTPGQACMASTGQAHRGLDPRAGLFLNDAGYAFEVLVASSACGQRCLCQEIHYAYRKIFRRVGYPGLSAMSVRYTVIDRLSRRGADDAQIGELLGIRELRLIKRERQELGDLVQELV